MNKNISIQTKAAFLLIVFSMNTVIGFACSMGLDMGFNKHHHEEEEAIETRTHHHADGNLHQHHHEAVKQHHDAKEDSKKDDCCNDKVIQFQNIDKNLAAKTIVTLPAIVAIITIFIGIDLFDIAKASFQKDLITRFYPPPKDILISIRKFQV